MIKLTFKKVAAAAAALTVAGATFGTATASAASPMPLSNTWRACDFSSQSWVDAVGNAQAIAYVGPAGDGSMVAKIDMATALPNARYDVRVIQTPRPSIGCGPGAPGVLTGSLQTDGIGTGSVTINGPVASGKTGAWVFVELPSAYSQTPEEFYTSGFIASI